MAGTRYGHKIRAKLKSGKSYLSEKKGSTRTDFHTYSPDGFISVEELSEIFFTTVEKIKKARRLGIIQEISIPQSTARGKKYFFDRNEAINTLSKFKDKNGFLSI